MKEKALLLVSILCVIAMAMMPSIPQDASYHNFADQRAYFGISNFLNVISNMLFVLTGLAGIRLLIVNRGIRLVNSIRFVYGVFFAGLLLVGLGSGYYHLSPDNTTLLWDRLPMVVVFMSFFTVVLGEFINETLARRFFLPLMLTGLTSVFYWYWTESTGEGDLRIYILVQFLPMILMPIIFLIYQSCFTYVAFFWLVLVCYGVAKGFEVIDVEIYEYTGFVSGHTLKHLVSAAAPALIYLALIRRVNRNIKPV